MIECGRFWWGLRVVEGLFEGLVMAWQCYWHTATQK